MISFNLTCGFGHQFEGWFSSSVDYDDQQAKGLVACPICDNTAITKALMTPNVTAKGNQKSQNNIDMPSVNKPIQPHLKAEHDRMVMPQPLSAKPEVAKEMPPEMPPEMLEAAAAVMAEMRKVQKTIEAECDDVGDGFAEEARKIHYGEREPRGIYGRTSDEEANTLLDEGIDITRMPWLPKEQ